MLLYMTALVSVSMSKLRFVHSAVIIFRLQYPPVTANNYDCEVKLRNKVKTCR